MIPVRLLVVLMEAWQGEMWVRFANPITSGISPADVTRDGNSAPLYLAMLLL